MHIFLVPQNKLINQLMANKNTTQIYFEMIFLHRGRYNSNLLLAEIQFCQHVLLNKWSLFQSTLLHPYSKSLHRSNIMQTELSWLYLVKYMNIRTIKYKTIHIWKKARRPKYIEELGEGKWRGKWCNYIVIL